MERSGMKPAPKLNQAQIEGLYVAQSRAEAGMWILTDRELELDGKQRMEGHRRDYYRERNPWW